VTLVVPFIGWLFGIAMALISGAWSNRAIVDSQTEGTSSFEVLLFVLGVIGGLLSAVYLGLRLRRGD